MDQLLQSVKIAINNKIYLKDPESSELGKKIIEHSIHSWQFSYNQKSQKPF